MPTYTNDGIRTVEGLAFVRGEGSTLYDQSGKAFVDWAAGIAVNALGHSDPEWAATIAKQAATLAHVSNLFHSLEALELAKMMVESSKSFQRVFFCNSGTEANEAALKFARKYQLVQAQKRAAAATAAAAGKDGKAAAPPPVSFGCKSTPPTACFTQGGICGCWPQASDNNLIKTLKTEIIAFKHSFHGRTMGALSATHKPQIRQPFAPFPFETHFARFNNLEGACVVLCCEKGCRPCMGRVDVHMSSSHLCRCGCVLVEQDGCHHCGAHPRGGWLVSSGEGIHARIARSSNQARRVAHCG